MTSAAISEAVRATECPDERLARSWERVIVDEAIKAKLINHALLALQIRPHFPFEATAVHGLIALVGAPGTGKTTLARGLPQQLSSVMHGAATRLVEVKPHGLMSAEHGRSQQLVDELLTEYLPGLAEDGVPTVVLLDEVESMAVARSETSLTANPVDVHRATDAVLTAMDELAGAAPSMIFVVTSNFVRGLDEAFLSRADAVLEFPLPSSEALAAIIADVLATMGTRYAALRPLAEDHRLRTIAAECVGLDGRQARKLVAGALARRVETAADPGQLTLAQLHEEARDARHRLADQPGEVARVRAA